MRQFIAEQNLDPNGCLFIEGKNFRYLNSVLRVKAGDMVDVRLPDNTLQKMTIARIDEESKKIILQAAGNIEDSSEVKNVPAESQLDLWLFQFAAKPPKMELILRQAVECGVRHFVPVAGTFCDKFCIESAQKRSESTGKDDRWGKIVTEARQQSGDPFGIEILPCKTVEEALALWKNQNNQEEVAVVLYEQTKNSQSLYQSLKNAEKIKKASVFVGAEGGISPQEIDRFCENGIIPVHFGTNILRCETAALYGIAALQTALLEKDLWQLRESNC